MRALTLLSVCALSACSNSIPNDVVVYEVPPPGFDAPGYAATEPYSYIAPLDGPATGTAAGSAVGLTQSGTVPQPVGVAGAGPGAGNVSQIGDDRLNLAEFSLEQQKIDAAAAEADLAAARSQLVVIQPTGVPQSGNGPNIALYAQQSTNAVGQSVYQRARGGRLASSCGRYSNGDDAQRAFLAAGGPVSDSLNLDPDGDGFACKWDPAPFRALR